PDDAKDDEGNRRLEEKDDRKVIPPARVAVTAEKEGGMCTAGVIPDLLRPGEEERSGNRNVRSDPLLEAPKRLEKRCQHAGVRDRRSAGHGISVSAGERRRVSGCSSPVHKI